MLTTAGEQAAAGLEVVPGLKRADLETPDPDWDNRWLGGGRAGAAVTVLAVVGPAVALAVMGYRYRWLADDGDIATRTVREILAGNGPVFNIGERAEVNTSALWTWLLAGVTYVSGRSVYPVVLAVSLVLGPASLLFASDATRRLYRLRPGAGLFLPVGAVVVAALPPFWEFMTSGLESPLIFCWIGLGWWLLVRVRPDSRGPLPYATAFVWGLGWLVRPDMAIATAFFLAALWFTLRPSGWRATALAASAFTVPLAYQVFRMGYYAQLVPNTAVAKSAGSFVFARGWAYLVNFVAPYLLWIPALLVLGLLVLCVPAARLPRYEHVKIATALGAGLCSVLYVVGIGGDFMHARMLLPGTFLLLLPAFVLPAPLAVNLRQGLAVVLTVLCALSWAVTCAGVLRLPDPARINASGVDDERAFWIGWTGDAHPTTPAPFLRHELGSGRQLTLLGRALREYGESNDRGLLFGLGKTGGLVAPLSYHVPVSMAVTTDLLGMTGAGSPLNALVVDNMGLAYPLASHLDLRKHARARHEKTVPLVWEIADYTPAWFTPTQTPTGLPPDTLSAAQVKAARTALRCGELAGFQTAVRAPLTWHRFVSNVFRSFSYTLLQVPSDPVAAEKEFCR
ncbi:MAG TPA: hypothetical protein VGG16_15450 [Streptosporangiaceae bacterium]